LLIGEDAQSWFAVHYCELHCPVEDGNNRLVIVNRGNELRIRQPFQYFLLE
jgi:hypothetical protein